MATGTTTGRQTFGLAPMLRALETVANKPLGALLNAHQSIKVFVNSMIATGAPASSLMVAQFILVASASKPMRQSRTTTNPLTYSASSPGSTI